MISDSPHSANLPAGSAPPVAGGRAEKPEPAESRGAVHEDHNECVPVTGPHVDDRTLARLLHDLDVAGDWHDDA